MECLAQNVQRVRTSAARSQLLMPRPAVPSPISKPRANGLTDSGQLSALVGLAKAAAPPPKPKATPNGTELRDYYAKLARDKLFHVGQRVRVTGGA